MGTRWSASSAAADIDAFIDAFRTISGASITLLQCLVGLQRRLSDLGAPRPLPRLDGLAERLARGWCDELPELLQTTLNRALASDGWAPISAAALRTSSVVDVFTHLDRLCAVYATFCQLPPLPLPPSCHGRLLELMETQVSTYAMRVAAVEPLPRSCLQKVRRGSALAAKQYPQRIGAAHGHAPPRSAPVARWPSSTR